MRTVTETEDFTRDALKIWTEAEYDAFVEWIAKNPLAGEVIPKADGRERCGGLSPALAKAVAFASSIST
jgi:hypothetical protein